MEEEEVKEIPPDAHLSSMEESFYSVFWLDKRGFLQCFCFQHRLPGLILHSLEPKPRGNRGTQNTKKFTSAPTHSPLPPITGYYSTCFPSASLLLFSLQVVAFCIQSGVFSCNRWERERLQLAYYILAHCNAYILFLKSIFYLLYSKNLERIHKFLY